MRDGYHTARSYQMEGTRRLTEPTLDAGEIGVEGRADTYMCERERERKRKKDKERKAF